jgi:transcriptional regulator with XRE-family HTH domain
LEQHEYARGSIVEEEVIDWGARLKLYRERNGLTQSSFAEFLEVDQTTLSRWERGRSDPCINTKKRLHQLLLPASSKISDLLQHLVDNYNGLAILLDHETRIVTTSAFHQRELGYELPDVIGKTWLSYVSADRREAIKAVLPEYERALAEGATRLRLTQRYDPGRRGTLGKNRTMLTVLTETHVIDRGEGRCYLVLARTLSRNIVCRVHVEIFSPDGSLVFESKF